MAAGRPDSEGDWHFENITPDLIQAERRTNILFEGSSQYQKIVIQDGAAFGRSLVLDDKTQSTALDEFVYHEALVQPTMIAHQSPQNIFVAGGGEGATAREILRHRVDRVVMVDIDEKVVELCKQYLPDHHQNSFKDSRLDLVIADAVEYLTNTTERFDVSIIDVPDPLDAGPAYILYTHEFYSLVRERLRPNGMMVVQAGPTGPAFYQQCFSAVTSTIATVFPVVAICEAFVPSFGSTWGFVVGSLSENPANLTPDNVDVLINERISTPLRYYDGITHRGMFSVPKYLREAVNKEDRIITKSDPLFIK